jgi:hypothetical protein
MSEYMPDSMLERYLQSNFELSNEYIEDFDRRIVQHFAEEFGVNVKIEGDLFLFKYSQFNADFRQPLTRECRGQILRRRKLPDPFAVPVFSWRTVCHPFDKFFNMHEPECPLSNPVTFHQLHDTLEMVEKVDGTLINLWFDDACQAFRASTLGNITPKAITGNPDGKCFESLFWGLLQADGRTEESIVETLSPENTYMFEMWHPEATAYTDTITQYDRPRLVLLAVRNNETGAYQPIDDYPFEKPKVIPMDTVKTSPLSAQQQFHKYATWMAEKTEGLGDIPEGFVLVDKETREPVAKVKMMDWLARHKLTQGNNYLKIWIASVLFGGAEKRERILGVDDMLQLFTPQRREIAIRVRLSVQVELADVVGKAMAFSAIWSGAEEGKRMSPKDYANAVKGMGLGFFEHFFFKHKDLLLDNAPHAAISDALMAYLLERNQRQDGVVNYFYDKYGKADGDGKENI